MTAKGGREEKGKGREWQYPSCPACFGLKEGTKELTWIPAFAGMTAKGEREEKGKGK